jgi:hypothetical protein
MFRISMHADQVRFREPPFTIGFSPHLRPSENCTQLFRNGSAHKALSQNGNKEVPMKKLAIGILAAAGIALSVPASAQGVWVGAGPVGVGVGVGPGWGYSHYDNGYYGPGYRSYAYDDGYAYRRHCRIVRENFNGHIRKIRQCW